MEVIEQYFLINVSILVHRVFAVLPDPWTISVQHKWNRGYQEADHGHDGQGPVSADVLVEWNSSNRQPSGNQESNNSGERES
jgi:hypothetical protein